tara:strand:+ start:19 stop:291 length:273 start_codon:yes stop_codon:yes gene_type:complete
MRKKKTYAMKRKGGAVKRMMKKGGAVKKFKPGGKVTAPQATRKPATRPAQMAGAAMGAGAGMMAGMTVAKAKKFLAGKGFNVTKKTKGPR